MAERYSLPQYIDVEDKIIGPLTLRQFLYLLTGGIIMFLVNGIFTLPGVIIIGFVVVPLAVAFAFYKPDGRQFSEWLLALLNFSLNPRLRLWAREPYKPPIKISIPVKEEETPVKEEISESRLSRLAEILDLAALSIVAKEMEAGEIVAAQPEPVVEARSSAPSSDGVQLGDRRQKFKIELPKQEKKAKPPPVVPEKQEIPPQEVKPEAQPTVAPKPEVMRPVTPPKIPSVPEVIKSVKQPELEEVKVEPLAAQPKITPKPPQISEAKPTPEVVEPKPRVEEPRPVARPITPPTPLTVSPQVNPPLAERGEEPPSKPIPKIERPGGRKPERLLKPVISPREEAREALVFGREEPTEKELVKPPIPLEGELPTSFAEIPIAHTSSEELTAKREKARSQLRAHAFEPVWLREEAQYVEPELGRFAELLKEEENERGPNAILASRLVSQRRRAGGVTVTDEIPLL
ncbi:MAG: PrgI family protein [Parcubacteria group bacterium]|nr:PrgI family protein [Parcubacteria group bacterium]